MKTRLNLIQFTPRNMKVQLTSLPDSLEAWIEACLTLTVIDVRVIGVLAESLVAKVRLQLNRFSEFLEDRYGHDKTGMSLFGNSEIGVPNRRTGKVEPLARKSVNNYLAGLSEFCGWLDRQHSKLCLGQFDEMRQRVGTTAPKVRALSEKTSGHTEKRGRSA